MAAIKSMPAPASAAAAGARVSGGSSERPSSDLRTVESSGWVRTAGDELFSYTPVFFAQHFALQRHRDFSSFK